MKPQFITNPNGDKISVTLPIKTYDKLMADLDELMCQKAYEKAKSGKLEFIPANEMFESIEKNHKKNVSTTN